jgi:hypothetical protein
MDARIGSDRVDDWEVAALRSRVRSDEAHAGTKVAARISEAGHRAAPTASRSAARISSPRRSPPRQRRHPPRALAAQRDRRTLRIKVDGTEAWSTTGNGSTWARLALRQRRSVCSEDSRRHRGAAVEAERRTCSVAGRSTISRSPALLSRSASAGRSERSSASSSDPAATAMEQVGERHGGSDLLPDMRPTRSRSARGTRGALPFVGPSTALTAWLPRNHEGFLGLALLRDSRSRSKR